MKALLSWPIARMTARGRGLAPLTLIATGVLVLLAVVRPPPQEKLTAAFSGLSAPWLFLLTLFLGAGLLSEEIESGHAQLVLLRPVTRAQYAGGRFVGAALVLCLAASAAWGAGLVAALERGSGAEMPGSLLVLPLALLPALGWLSTLLAISAVTRGWSNAGALVAARAAWFFAKVGLPLAFPGLALAPWLAAIDPWVGPQDALRLAGQVQNGEPARIWVVFWDLLWLGAAWLVAVRLFRTRELARRRA